MKKLLFLAALLIGGCSQTNTATPPTKLSDGYIAYTVGGDRDSMPDVLVAGDPGYKTLNCLFSSHDSALSIYGTMNHTEGLDLNVQGCIAPGKYSLTNAKSGFATYANSQYEIDSSISGSITITQLDTLRKLVSGSFHFMAKRPQDGNVITIDGGTLSSVPFVRQ